MLMLRLKLWRRFYLRLEQGEVGTDFEVLEALCESALSVLTL